MKTYRTYLTLADPNRLVLTDLPFESGQAVEIFIRPKQEKASVEELKSLMKKTRKLPQTTHITEEDIKTEIENYRKGR